LAAQPAKKGSVAPLFKTYYAAAADAARACAPTRKDCQASGGTLSEDMFCKEFMNCLADRGNEDGRAYASGTERWRTLQDLNPVSAAQCEPAGSTRRFAR